MFPRVWAHVKELALEPIVTIVLALALTCGIVSVNAVSALALGEITAGTVASVVFGVALLLLLSTGGGYIASLATDALHEKRRRAVTASSPSSSPSHDEKTD